MCCNIKKHKSYCPGILHNNIHIIYIYSWQVYIFHSVHTNKRTWKCDLRNNNAANFKSILWWSFSLFEMHPFLILTQQKKKNWLGIIVTWLTQLIIVFISFFYFILNVILNMIAGPPGRTVLILMMLPWVNKI